MSLFSKSILILSFSLIFSLTSVSAEEVSANDDELTVLFTTACTAEQTAECALNCLRDGLNLVYFECRYSFYSDGSAGESCFCSSVKQDGLTKISDKEIEIFITNR